jgi:hypothetical protein
MAKSRRPPPTEYTTSGVEDILAVAYKMDQTAEFKRSSGHSFLPTYEWLKEQARVLRKALEKEGLHE